MDLSSTLKCRRSFPLYRAQARHGKGGAETEGLEGAVHLEWLLECTKIRYKLIPMIELQTKEVCVNRNICTPN